MFSKRRWKVDELFLASWPPPSRRKCHSAWLFASATKLEIFTFYTASGKRKIETLVVGCPPHDAMLHILLRTQSCRKKTAAMCNTRKSNLRVFLNIAFVLLLDADDAQQQWSENSLSTTYLLQYRSDVLQRQRRKLILLEEVVQVLLEHFKHQACVVLVLKALKGPNEIELVGVLLAEAWQDGDFNLTLAGVGWMVLEDFDGDDVARAFLPAFHHLPESAATEEFQNLKINENWFKLEIFCFLKSL